MATYEVHIARQPVFGRRLDLEAYALTAWSTDLRGLLAELDEQAAAAKVVHDAFLDTDVRAITDGLPAHVAVPASMLIDGSVEVLPPDGTVLEVEPSGEPTVELVRACRTLQQRGFRIALGGVRAGDPRVGVVPADVVAVPFDDPRPGVAERAVHEARNDRLRVLASEVHDGPAYRLARALDADAFKGSFFRTPTLVEGRRLTGTEAAHLSLLREVHRAELDYAAIEESIKRDPALSWKLLNYLNSAYFGWRSRVRSIRQGLVLIGEQGVRRWVSLLGVSSLASGVPPAVVTVAIGRGRFAELLAERIDGIAPVDAFVTGLFSMLTAMVDEPLERILEGVAIGPEIEAALLDRAGDLGTLLQLVVAYEDARHDDVPELAETLGLAPAAIREDYRAAMEWASGREADDRRGPEDVDEDEGAAARESA